MIPVTNLRAGTVFKEGNKVFLVLKYTHTKMGRGTATVKVKVRDLKTKATVEKTFISDASVEPAEVVKQRFQYLYHTEDDAVFMNPDNFEQVSIPLSVVGKGIKFLQTSTMVDVLFYEGEPISIILPPKVNLKVVEAAPGVKGNSADNVYKDVVLENGLRIKAPLFVKVGDMLRIDTQTGEYVERVS